MKNLHYRLWLICILIALFMGVLWQYPTRDVQSSVESVEIFDIGPPPDDPCVRTILPDENYDKMTCTWEGGEFIFPVSKEDSLTDTITFTLQPNAEVMP